MILTVIFFGALCIFCCWMWWKFCRFLFWPKNKRTSNPYIDAHKVKIKNDRDYDLYLKWLGKNGEGVPLDKMKTREDADADRKISNLMK